MTKLFTFALTFQCLSMSLLLAHNGNAQVKNIEDVSVHLSLNEVKVEKAFKKLEKITEFNFVFATREIRNSPLVSLESNGGSLYDLLVSIGSQSHLSFKQVDGNIHVKKSDKISVTTKVYYEDLTVSGAVTDKNGEPIPGVTVSIPGTSIGTATDLDGKYSLSVPEESTLIFSFIGYETQSVVLGTQSIINVVLSEDISSLDEVVVVGYGEQKKSDITGSVASIPKERLEMVPIINVAQAIQGSIPGVMVQNTSAGAEPTQNIMVRGRNSIAANNSPLVVVDGVPYGGNLSDINPNDIESIEILKDASASAIYGSRGANGIILITTKSGNAGELKISYNGFYSVQDPTNVPDILNGEEFYQFKMARAPHMMTIPEQEIYESREWVNWYDEILQTGFTHNQHVSVSGGTQKTQFFMSGGLLDVKGITLNDNYLRGISRVNVETKINDWLSLGTRSQFSYDDQSGNSPSWADARSTNPLVKPYDENGNPTIYPWEGMPQQGNPLEGLLFDNKNESFQINLNNFAVINIPKIEGLSYRINTGFNFIFRDQATYKGRDTRTGLEVQGEAETSRYRYNSTLIENILSYKKNIDNHSIFGTALYSFESNKSSSNNLLARGFENDHLTYYAAEQANFISPNYNLNESYLISQMLRVNYAFDSRYLVTVTGRRDGFSGFGKSTKWGIFPSIALGWNIGYEDFFTFKDVISELKLRASYGLNGNQAVGSYQSITRLGEYHYVDSKETAPGYRPTILGDPNLAWESSRTFNVGLDMGFLNNRFVANVDIYETSTTDLLLNRIISSVHGISSLTTNIGETNNKGVEFSILSRNIITPAFSWTTNGNISANKNKIVSLYGILDEDGQEIDDYANNWFIGQPISANYDFDVIGTWQLDEVDEATKWGSVPGQVKIDDINGDYKLDNDDRKILGQEDPVLMWGLTNTFTLKNFTLNVFIHGMHGITKSNSLMNDHVLEEVRNNTIKKDWWTPNNPTNEWYGNWLGADVMGGILARNRIYQNASFVRIKDVSLSYLFPQSNILGVFNNVRVAGTGRNLYTFTNWIGLDPELSSQTSIPLQRELVLSLNVSF